MLANDGKTKRKTEKKHLRNKCVTSKNGTVKKNYNKSRVYILTGS